MVKISPLLRIVAEARLAVTFPLLYDTETQGLHLIDPLLVSTTSELCCLLKLNSQEFGDKTPLTTNLIPLACS